MPRRSRRARSEAKQHSSTDFIVAASGIEQRYVLDKTGVLDPDVMHPWLRAVR
jgi:beta-ketodecanoyl-[acyl-carrier-protein] synthase